MHKYFTLRRDESAGLTWPGDSGSSKGSLLVLSQGSFGSRAFACLLWLP